MRIAQQLYEGVDVKGEGTVGVITYLRTDSRVLPQRRMKLQELISSRTTERNRQASAAENSNRNAQDAHEAIRPTDIRRTPALIKDS